MGTTYGAPQAPQQGSSTATGSTPATPNPTVPPRPVAPSKASQALPAWAANPNPQVAKALAACATGLATGTFTSAAAMCRKVGVHGKANQRAVRQVLRNAGMGVGRGNTYNGKVGTKLAQAGRKVHAANAKAAKQAAKAAK